MTDFSDHNDTTWLDQFDLSNRQRDFVLAYLKDPNQTRAAKEAGYKQPHVHGSRLLGNDRVRKAIETGRQKLEKAAMMEAEDVAKMWVKIATADVGELIENRHGPCRYCWGKDHHYQWTTERAYREAYEKSVYSLFADEALRERALAGGIEDPRLPNAEGGFGYRITDVPNPDCPECAGEGIEVTRMADTRTLSPAARLLYDGVEETRQGRKIKMQDRARALENLAKHLGMFAGKVAPEEINPLEALAARIIEGAAPVPVRPDASIEDDDEITAQPSAFPADDDQDDEEEVEP